MDRKKPRIRVLALRGKTTRVERVTIDSLHSMSCKSFARAVNHPIVILILHVSNDFEVGQSPSMPRPVPHGIIMRSKHVAVQDVVDVPLEDALVLG
jgi:hypothetical protein